MKKRLSLPVTLRVTLYYTVFISLVLLFVIWGTMVMSKQSAIRRAGKELEKQVSRMAGGKEIITYNGEIYFVPYRNDLPERELPAGWGEALFSRNNATIKKGEDGRNYLYADVPIPGEDRRYLRGILPLSPTEEALRSVGRTLLLLSPLIIGGIGFGGRQILKRAFQPVGEYAESAENIGVTGDFSRRLPESDRDDEITFMAEVFNRMLDRLEEGVERERRFTSDVSHELRTPLSVILGETDFALEEDDPEEMKKSLQVIRRQGRKMEELMKRILDLSALEGQGVKTFLPVDFSALVRERMEDYGRTVNPGILWEVRIEPGLFTEGDRFLLGRMVDNLWSNGVKFTQDKVLVQVEPKGEEILFSVTDNGPGIPESEREKVWNRFYQGDPSRKQKGFGLGLSFVDEIVRLHRGRRRIVSDPGKETTVEIFLPLKK